MANEYVTATVLKATLSLTGETFADADVTTACTAASRAIDNLTNRRFWVDANANQVLYYTAESPRFVRIDDLVTLTTFKVDVDGDGTFETTLTNNTDFTLYPLNAAATATAWPYTYVKSHPLTSTPFPGYPRSIEITGKFGWSAVPEPITNATTILAHALVRRAREAPFGIITLGVEEATRIGRSDPHVNMLIDPYRKLSY